MYKSKIIADSLSPQGDRLISFVIKLPKIVVSEFYTHKMFTVTSSLEKNSFMRNIEELKLNFFTPISYIKRNLVTGKSKFLNNESDLKVDKEKWVQSKQESVHRALNLFYSGVDPELCTRLLEPFMISNVIITTSKESLEDFFKMKCPQYEMMTSYNICKYKSKKDFLNNVGLPDEKSNYSSWNYFDWLQINKSKEDIHIQQIAEMMWDSMNESKPKQLEAGEWHIPFDDDIKSENFKILCLNNPYDNEEELRVEISTSKCSEVSYQNTSKDYKLHIEQFKMLVETKQFKFFEHCSIVMDNLEYNSYHTGKNDIEPNHNTTTQEDVEYLRSCMGWCKNYRGFIPLSEIII